MKQIHINVQNETFSVQYASYKCMRIVCIAVCLAPIHSYFQYIAVFSKSFAFEFRCCFGERILWSTINACMYPNATSVHNYLIKCIRSDLIALQLIGFDADWEVHMCVVRTKLANQLRVIFYLKYAYRPLFCTAQLITVPPSPYIVAHTKVIMHI